MTSSAGPADRSGRIACRCFVVGIAGKGDEHLDILSQIALIFSEEEEVERLKAAATPEDLYALLSSVND